MTNDEKTFRFSVRGLRYPLFVQHLSKVTLSYRQDSMLPRRGTGVIMQCNRGRERLKLSGFRVVLERSAMRIGTVTGQIRDRTNYY